MIAPIIGTLASCAHVLGIVSDTFHAPLHVARSGNLAFACATCALFVSLAATWLYASDMTWAATFDQWKAQLLAFVVPNGIGWLIIGFELVAVYVYELDEGLASAIARAGKRREKRVRRE